MLYFVKPDGELLWTANVGQELLDIAAKTGKDLGSFPEWWEASERRATPNDVRAAIRHGLAASGGIIVEAGHIIALHRPAELRALAAESSVRTAEYNALPQVRHVDEYLEALMPGWKQHGRDVDEGVADSLRESIAEADEEAKEVLDVPVNETLAAHWGTLGAALPDPI